MRNQTVTQKIDQDTAGRFNNILKRMVPYFGIIIIIILFTMLTGGKFISLSNIQLIIKQSIIIIVAGFGATIVQAHGNMDLSLGGIIATAGVAGWMLGNINPWLVIPGCIITGIIISTIVGGIHVAARIPHFMVGLSMMFIGRGIAQAAVQTRQMYAPSIFVDLDNIYFYMIVLIVVFVLAYIVLEYTKIGRYNKLIGANPNSSKLSGISVNRYKMYAFMCTGFTVGLCALLVMVRIGGVSQFSGSGVALDVVLALVIGGTSLSGGSDTKMHYVIIGALILTFLSNGLILVGVTPDLVNIIRACVFLGAVYFAYSKGSDQLIL